MTYKEELIKSMDMLAQNEKVIFIGQHLLYPIGFMPKSLKNVSNRRKIELPLVEDVQMGMSIGLALEGYIPVSIYPRMDFLILAINQLVNHLDKIEKLSSGRFKPKVIIRVAIGSTKPLYPDIQHCSDYTDALRCMLKNVVVIKLLNSKDILPSYEYALKSEKSTLLIEVADLYESD